MKKTQKIGLLLLLLCAVAVFAVACKADPKPVGPTSYTISFYSDDQLTDTLQTVGGESLTLPVPAERELLGKMVRDAKERCRKQKKYQRSDLDGIFFMTAAVNGEQIEKEKFQHRDILQKIHR